MYVCKFIVAVAVFIIQHNTFQVILLTDGTTSYSVFLYNSMNWGQGATIGFSNGTSMYRLDERLPDFNVGDLPFSSNVGVDGVFIFRTESGKHT